MEDINRGLALFRNTPGAVLIDLRDEEDFAEGHIPGAVNMLPETIREQITAAAQKDTPIFLYCYGGMRSYQAEALLQARGYQRVTSIGGMDRYDGDLEEGVPPSP
ncbi:MAG: rhodanese-like domain-containing protein [Clostridia bacterium]|nr:rhodanese-like domain-containing protein [Clostridia bacterium]